MRMPGEDKLRCLHCRGPIIGRYALAKYCCSNCRQKVHNAKWLKTKRDRRGQASQKTSSCGFEKHMQGRAR
jgi:hypothetical protein